MQESWFDTDTGLLRLDEIIMARPSYRLILEDGQITPAEFRAQAERVANLLHRLEKMLTPEAHAVADDTIAELAVLLALSARMQTTERQMGQ